MYVLKIYQAKEILCFGGGTITVHRRENMHCTATAATGPFERASRRMGRDATTIRPATLFHPCDAGVAKV